MLYKKKLKEVNILDDQNSLISMFRGLAKEKERKEAGRLSMIVPNLAR